MIVIKTNCENITITAIQIIKVKKGTEPVKFKYLYYITYCVGWNCSTYSNQISGQNKYVKCELFM